jgi:hypothetical protein
VMEELETWKLLRDGQVIADLAVTRKNCDC